MQVFFFLYHHIAIKLRIQNYPKINSILTDTYEKVNFSLWGVIQYISLTGMWGATPV